MSSPVWALKWIKFHFEWDLRFKSTSHLRSENTPVCYDVRVDGPNHGKSCTRSTYNHLLLDILTSFTTSLCLATDIHHQLAITLDWKGHCMRKGLSKSFALEPGHLDYSSRINCSVLSNDLNSCCMRKTMESRAHGTRITIQGKQTSTIKLVFTKFRFWSSSHQSAVLVTYPHMFILGASNPIHHGPRCTQAQMKYAFTLRISATNTTFENTASFNIKLRKLPGTRIREAGM